LPDPSPAHPQLRREIGLRDLVLFNIAAVVGIRWLAAAAHAGPGSLVLWVLAAALFFVPSALSVAALSRRYPEEGGLYVWTKRNYGDWHGFLAGWCFWLSNLFYFPNLLLAGVGISAYTLGPRYFWLAENRVYMLGASLLLLWGALLSHLFGVRQGKWTGNIGGMATYFAGGLVIVAGLFAWMHGGSATPLQLMPKWNLEKVNFWSQIAFAFGGLELGAVMGGEIRRPDKTVPKAAFISGAAITVFYILGTLALLVVLPSERISVMTGLAQAGQSAGERLGFTLFGPLLAILITVGLLGQLGAWVGGSARIPFVIGLDSYLPPAFAKLHPKWGTPWFSLLTQGAACTVFLLIMLTGESLQAGYQLLVDMTVVTYFVPFLYIFMCAWRCGQRLAAASGLFTTLCGIGFSLIPPEGTVSPVWFIVKLLVGCAALVVAGRITFNRARRSL
jgi:amino acid transporter